MQCKKCVECGTVSDSSYLECRACGAVLPPEVFENNTENYEQFEEKATVESGQNDATRSSSIPNSVANIFKYLAVIIFIVGFIAGPVLVESVGGIMMFVVWVVSFVEGMLFWGFAEIIQLLSDIKANTAKT